MKDPVKRWDVMVRLIKENDFSSFCEIGVKDGGTTYRVLQNTKAKVYACDQWRYMPEQADLVGGETYKNLNWKSVQDKFWHRVDPYLGRLEFFHGASVDFAPALKDESIDIVFIDASHDYESIRTDIDLYYPKVRKGGILSGHDYQPKFPGVIQAVTERFGECNLEEDSVWWIRK